MFGTIVVGVDASGHADHAVQTVAKIAAETKDKVVVFHGIVIHTGRGAVHPSEEPDETQHLVDRYVAQLTSAGVSATGEVRREMDIGVRGPLVDVALIDEFGLGDVST